MWFKAQEWAGLSRENTRREESRGTSWEALGSLSSSVARRRECWVMGAKAVRSGWPLNTCSCLRVSHLDKVWEVSIGFGGLDVIGDLSKSCFRNSRDRSQNAVGEALWEVRGWRQQGLSICQSRREEERHWMPPRGRYKSRQVFLNASDLGMFSLRRSQ